MPVDSERASQEVSANAMMEEARQAEIDGKTAKAKGLYQTIVKKYPFTQIAADASYQYALIVRHTGKMDDAFNALQNFIQAFRDSPHFAEAIEKQFEIAA